LTVARAGQFFLMACSGKSENALRVFCEVRYCLFNSEDLQAGGFTCAVRPGRREIETPMWPYLVAYDFERHQTVEPVVKQRLLKMNGRQIMDRLWVVVADEGASTVLSRLGSDLAATDQLLVLELAEDYASMNVKSLRD
jgi:hypothetical protein